MMDAILIVTLSLSGSVMIIVVLTQRMCVDSSALTAIGTQERAVMMEIWLTMMDVMLTAKLRHIGSAPIIMHSVPHFQISATYFVLTENKTLVKNVMMVT